MMTVAMDQMNPPSVLMLNVGKDGLVVQHLIGVYVYIFFSFIFRNVQLFDLLNDYLRILFKTYP